MAKAIHYDVPETPKAPSANDELQALLETLHQQGLLRILNEVLQASPDISKVLLNGLNRRESRNAVQNISLIAMTLGRIPPERFVLFTDSLLSAAKALRESVNNKEDSNKAPGVLGAYKLLHDDDLWRAIQPLVAAVDALLRPLEQEEQDPAARREDEDNKANRNSDGAST